MGETRKKLGSHSLPDLEQALNLWWIGCSIVKKKEKKRWLLEPSGSSDSNCYRNVLFFNCYRNVLPFQCTVLIKIMYSFIVVSCSSFVLINWHANDNNFWILFEFICISISILYTGDSFYGGFLYVTLILWFFSRKYSWNVSSTSDARGLISRLSSIVCKPGAQVHIFTSESSVLNP